MNEQEQDAIVEGTKGRQVLVHGAIRTTTTTIKTILQQFLFPIGTKGDCHATPPPKELSPLVVCIARITVVVVIHQGANPDQYQGGVAIDCRVLLALPPVYLCGQFSYSCMVWGRLLSTTTDSDKVSLI